MVAAAISGGIFQPLAFVYRHRLGRWRTLHDSAVQIIRLVSDAGLETSLSPTG
jgi:hypothetical protein